ncbi:hypothetical protein GCM10009647_058300 [Streptomyces sanglieri]|uniref:Secreted protein n=1 Tax=Streptomyces sanglieri TaxID=193460 RepID=A0ABW2WKR5_9ACTN
MTTLVLTRKTLQLTAMAVPLAGWTLHTTVLHRRLTQSLNRTPTDGRPHLVDLGMPVFTGTPP